MTINSALPILYPSRANELPVEVTLKDGFISHISTTIDCIDIRFTKDETAGGYTPESFMGVDSSFLDHIASQLVRVFG